MRATPSRASTWHEVVPRWLFVFFALAGPQVVDAQAWLPAKGSFSAAFTYNNVLNLKHYTPEGDEVDAGHTRSATYGLNFAYSPTEKLMLVAGLPYVTTRYWGDRPHPGEIDNGQDHSTLDRPARLRPLPGAARAIRVRAVTSRS